MTLLISKDKTKMFEKLFKILKRHNCEVGLFSDGLKYRNQVFQGIVYKSTFIEYPEVKHIKITNLTPKIKEVVGAEKMFAEISF